MTLHLRWLVTETEREYNTSWNSSAEKMKYTERSESVLQYSLDGVEYKTVPTVIEKVKGD